MPRRRFPSEPSRADHPPSQGDSLEGIGAAGIAAIIAGVLAALALALVVGVLLRTRRRRRFQSASASGSNGSGSDRE